MPSFSTARITDFACGFPHNLIERYNIAIIPQVVVWGETVLGDRVEITGPVLGISTGPSALALSGFTDPA